MSYGKVTLLAHKPKMEKSTQINKLWCKNIKHFYILHCPFIEGRDKVVGIASGNGLDDKGIESRWGQNFPHPLPICPVAHPASYTIGAESFPGNKRSGPGVDHPPQLAPKLKKE
jgi:hypothetical protein